MVVDVFNVSLSSFFPFLRNFWRKKKFKWKKNVWWNHFRNEEIQKKKIQSDLEENTHTDKLLIIHSVCVLLCKKYQEGKKIVIKLNEWMNWFIDLQISEIEEKTGNNFHFYHHHHQNKNWIFQFILMMIYKSATLL